MIREPARVERGIDQRPRELALVDVERADGHRPRRHPFDELPVDVVLLVFGGHVRRAADEHELRSIQADAFGARRERHRDVVGALDVGLQRRCGCRRVVSSGPVACACAGWRAALQPRARLRFLPHRPASDR